MKKGRIKSIDFLVQYQGGNLYIMSPESNYARQWVKENSYLRQWQNTDQIAISARNFNDLYDIMIDDGLVLHQN